jgi:hypothetical protein
VDLHGKVLWHRPLPSAGGQLRVSAEGGLWMATRRDLLETLPDGRPGRCIEFDQLPGSDLGAFVILPDGFLVAWTSNAVPETPIRLERIDRAGACRWRCELPASTLSYAGVVHVGVATDRRVEPVPAWRTRQVRTVAWEPLLVSGGVALATYVEPRSGIGVSYAVDLDTGVLCWHTRAGPPGDRAIAASGEFLIGWQGYGAFSTSLYHADGTIGVEWPSQGRPLVDASGTIRVIELENCTPSRSRIRILHRDGTTSDGPILSGYYTIGPVLAADGRVAFWRDGHLNTAGADLTVTTHHSVPDGDGVGSMLLLDGGLLAFALSRHSHPTLMFARTDLPGADRGIWHCGEGSLRANPVHP